MQRDINITASTLFMMSADRSHPHRFMVGVPVLPTRLMPIPIPAAAELDDVTHTFTTTPKPANQSEPAAAATVERKWTLKHVDFTPQLNTQTKKNENFGDVLKRFNEWLADNSQVAFATIETITWTSLDQEIFTDNTIIRRSLTSDTRYVRGIRAWYFVWDDTFYAKNDTKRIEIKFVDYVTDKKKCLTTSDLIKKLNSDIGAGDIKGKILKIETIHVPSSDTTVCVWKENASNDKHWTTFLRLFYDTSAPAKYGQLVVKDYLPQRDNRSKENQGFELYEDMWKRVARSVYENSGLHPICVQSLFVKFKDDMEQTPVYEKCSYTEHADYGKTRYVQMVRVVMSTSQPVYEGGGALVNEKVKAPVRLSYHTFVPTPLVTNGNDKKRKASIDTFEDIRQVEVKVNEWLQATGAILFGIDSLPIRVLTKTVDKLCSEATYIHNTREGNMKVEHSRFNFRLYLLGEYSPKRA